MQNKTLYSKEGLLRQYDDYIKLGIENIDGNSIYGFKRMFTEINADILKTKSDIDKRINELKIIDLIGRYYKCYEYNHDDEYLYIWKNQPNLNSDEILKISKIEGNNFYEKNIDFDYLDFYQEITKEEWIQQLEILENNLEQFIKKTILHV